MDSYNTSSYGNSEASAEMPQQSSSNFVSNETVCHLRNLVLNSNTTITAAPLRTLKNNQENEISEATNGAAPSKMPKISTDVNTNEPKSFDPLRSLPLSLISNGTLSVTSESSCVTIENGVPILKEMNNANTKCTAAAAEKQLNVSTGTATVAPPVAEIAAKSIPENDNVDENSKSLKDIDKTLNDNKQQIEKLNINKLILEALTDVTKENSFGKVGLIPNPNQMYFLTLLGLELVVDSCCSTSDNDVPKDVPTPADPLQCGQCQTDFTPKWHFSKNPSKVLCERCYQYNEEQILKAAQAARLSKEYKKFQHLKRKSNGTYKVPIPEGVKQRTGCGAATASKQATSSPSSHEQNNQFQNYINAAGLYMKDDDSVSDLTVLGAAIASNNEIFEAAKIVNSLDSNASPLSRAMAVQNFQISLFKGLRQKLAGPPNSSMDGQMQEQPLLHYQKTIAQMMADANLKDMQPEKQDPETQLVAILRAIELQQQHLMKTILKQKPNF